MSFQTDVQEVADAIATGITNQTTDRSITKVAVSGVLNDILALLLELYGEPDDVTTGLGLTINGGNVDVAPGTWTIEGVTYESLNIVSLLLDVQDPSESRYDSVYADNTGTIGIVRGGMAATPTPPDIPDNAVLLGDVFITPTQVIINPVVKGVVLLTTNQTIRGKKTFITSPIVPNPTVAKGAVNLQYLQSQLAGIVVSFNGRTGPVTLTGADILAALGYTPENIAHKGSASGYVPLNSSSKIDPAYLPDATAISWGQITGSLSAQTDLVAALAAKQNSLGFTPENIAHKDQPNGYAGLDGSGLLKASQWPAGIDKVEEFANLAAFPTPGASNIIYLALDTSKQYRWSGSTYIPIIASPGTTDAVPEGSTNKYFTTARVLATLLTGLGVPTAAAIASTDSILVMAGKLQSQITQLYSRALPAGGSVGQVLTKVNGTDYNAGWVDGAAIKGYQLMMMPVGLNEVTFYFPAAGNITAGILDARGSGLKLKTGSGGTYPSGSQTYPFAYAAGDVVYATFNYANLSVAEVNIILTCQDT